jgi:hypothetical protein
MQVLNALGGVPNPMRVAFNFYVLCCNLITSCLQGA